MPGSPVAPGVTPPAHGAPAPAMRKAKPNTLTPPATGHMMPAQRPPRVGPPTRPRLRPSDAGVPSASVAKFRYKGTNEK